jgi:hypothetical protein
MEPEGSLPHSKVPATCLYPEPAQSSPYPTSYFLKIRLNIILPFTSRSTQLSLSLMFSHQNPVHTSPYPIRTTCPAHLILLDFITRTIVVRIQIVKLSLCSFLRFPVTLSLVGPNILNTFSRTVFKIVV